MPYKGCSLCERVCVLCILERAISHLIPRPILFWINVFRSRASLSHWGTIFIHQVRHAHQQATCSHAHLYYLHLLLFLLLLLSSSSSSRSTFFLFLLLFFLFFLPPPLPSAVHFPPIIMDIYNPGIACVTHKGQIMWASSDENEMTDSRFPHLLFIDFSFSWNLQTCGCLSLVAHC